MKLLCKNNRTKVYDDGENYLVKTEGMKDELISKRENKPYPLACCLKWGMEPVDIDYLNKLSNELYKNK